MQQNNMGVEVNRAHYKNLMNNQRKVIKTSRNLFNQSSAQSDKILNDSQCNYKHHGSHQDEYHYPSPYLQTPNYPPPNINNHAHQNSGLTVQKYL